MVMKIRNHKNREWLFYHPADSKLGGSGCKSFKYKSSLMKYLKANPNECIGGEVVLDYNGFGTSHAIREWYVWYNEYKFHNSGANFKIELRQISFNNKKFIHKPEPTSKSRKRYFAFSDKVINLMCKMGQDDYVINSKDAKKLLTLFVKRGFIDFEPDKEEWDYINAHIKEGIPFYYWSDRCNFLRTKAILVYFIKNNLI